jgi:hypothetical protein
MSQSDERNRALMKSFVMSAAAWLILGQAASGFAQGVQTGTIRGMVKDQQDLAMPRVAVTATSPALQGTRTAATDSRGAYSLRALPPGRYHLVFELSGFASLTRDVIVRLGLDIEENASMRAAGISEQVNVVAGSPPPIETPIVGANFTHEDIEALATPRTIEGIAQLAPALNENGPQDAGQVVVNGAFAFDNVFMVNGVEIDDNLFGQPQNLFVEDAIQETQVLTSGISAEYGRFTGGVVNAVTKSGGNRLSGSYRTNFSNPAWTTATPFEVERGQPTIDAAHPKKLSASYEGTFGGPFVRDRLWFFAAGRHGSMNTTTTLNQTGTVLPTRDLNTRGEIKLTYSPIDGHTVQAGYLTDPRTRTNNSGLQTFVITPDSEVTRSNPNWYYYTNYRGVVKNTMLEGQYSQRRFQFVGDGGTSTDVAHSPILSATQCACVYNAPYFDATDPESRNNRQITGSATHLWSAGGRHDTKGGYEFYRSQRVGGNSQSSTGYVFNSDFVVGADDTPVLDAHGHVIPVFIAGLSSVDHFLATRGATMNTDTQSVYVQDHWTMGARWSADLGARYEHVLAKSTGDVVSARNNRVVPRLAVAFDPGGDGARIVHATYGWYSGRYDEAQIGANSPVGNPSDLNTIYTGPVGEGVNFAPGFDLANYPTGPGTSASAPTANVFNAPDLKSPLVREFSMSYGENLGGGRGYVRVAYVHRRTVDLIEDYQRLSDGFTAVTLNGVVAGTFTNVVYANAPADQASRVFDAMTFQSQYQLNRNWSVAGHYTLQLRNDGNYEGENTGQPGRTSFIGNYPEAFDAARNFPDGRLQSFERSRLRLWSIYRLPMGRFGDLSLSGLWRVDSGLVYAIRQAAPGLTSTQAGIIAAAGYPDQPGTTSSTSGYFVYYTPRGAETFKGYGVADVSIHYDVPIVRSLQPWVKFDVYNLFNDQKLIAWDVSVDAAPGSPNDSLGIPTGYVPRPTFGTATGNTIALTGLAVNAFPVAFGGALPGGRTITVAVGFRF